MAKFDTRLYAQQVGEGGDPLKSAAITYGVPDCMIAIGERALKLLSSIILGAMKDDLEDGIASAEDAKKNESAEMRWIMGLSEVTTADGLILYISDTFGLKLDQGKSKKAKKIKEFLDKAAEYIQLGGRLYNNAMAIKEDVEAMMDCIKAYKDTLDYSGDSATDIRAELPESQFLDYVQAEFAASLDTIAELDEYIASATAVVNTIDSILLERARDPSKEPQFADDLSQAQIEGLNTFRLTYGPPRTTQGQFLQSIDGYYYDSQTSGIIPALIEIKKQSEKIKNENRWKLEHDPNLGGRGKQYSFKDIQYYVNTILDPNIVDESDFLSKYYKADTTLKELIGTRDKRVLDIRSQVDELSEQPNPSQAVLYNLNQVLLSESSHFQEKINKRKKQIELAVKLPSIYKGTSLYGVGKIPVNDFSYLEGINYMLDIEKQRALVLDQESVSGVVKPLSATFVVAPMNNKEVTLDHLLIHGPGLGSIIYDSSSYSGIDPTRLSISPIVVEDKLFAMYNFLQSYTALPSSSDFKVLNSITENSYNNAQLNALHPSSVFKEGLSIPYLEGITKHSSVDITKVSSMGSFVKLPDSNEFKDFLYSKDGATFETWVKVPDLINGFGTSSYYRLILACENTGLASNVTPQKDEVRLVNQNGDSVVKGLLLGFTRDRRFTKNLVPNNNSADNPEDEACLFIAPTQSMDASTVGFINKKCGEDNVWNSMVLKLAREVDGKPISSIQNEFCHLCFTFDPKSDSLSVYFDGTLVDTKPISEIFSVDKYTMPKIPSLKKNNSFEYSITSVGLGGPKELWDGPKLGEYFTPWILGGGYTDGMTSKGNFMGGQYGGVYSGLRGYLGSVKFYNKPLAASEVINNYEAQKAFFKNVRTD